MICQMSCQQTIIWTKKTSRRMSNDGMTYTMGSMHSDAQFAGRSSESVTTQW
jgi:hypothetical protein